MEETRRSLFGMHRLEQNMTSAQIGINDSSFVVQFPLLGITRGSYLAIDDEIIYVWAVNPSSNTISTCTRGMLGTDPQPHFGNTIVEVNPRFARYAIRYALREEIRSWGPQVYQVKQALIPAQNLVRGYDLAQLVADNFYEVKTVRRSTPTISGVPNQENWPKIRNWNVMRPAPRADFPSGAGLVIPDSWTFGTNYASPDGISLTYTGDPLPTLAVTYSCPFNIDGFEDSTDVLNTVGLDPTMIDIPPVGAAWRLLSQRETIRTAPESQGEPADLQNTPPMYIAKAASALKMLRDSRLADSQVLLINRYGLENWGL